MRTDWYVFIAAGIFVGLYVYACIFWCSVAIPAPGESTSPQQFSGNTPLELLYVAFRFLMVWRPLRRDVCDRDADRSRRAASRQPGRGHGLSLVVGFQYPGGFATYRNAGRRRRRSICPLGETTEIDLRSADVTHSFWVPAFLFKRDAIPGMTNVFDLTPTRTGNFLGRCAQYCGLDHALMSFTLRSCRGPRTIV